MSPSPKRPAPLLAVIGKCDKCGTAATKHMLKVRAVVEYRGKTMTHAGIAFSPDAVSRYGPGFLCQSCFSTNLKGADVTLLEYFHRPDYQ